MSTPERRALGSDPFTHGDGTLAYLMRLRNRTFRVVRSEEETHVEAPPQPATGPPPDLGPPVPEVSLGEEVDPAEGALDRIAGWLLDPEVEERLRNVAAELGA